MTPTYKHACSLGIIWRISRLSLVLFFFHILLEACLKLFPLELKRLTYTSSSARFRLQSSHGGS